MKLTLEDQDDLKNGSDAVRVTLKILKGILSEQERRLGVTELEKDSLLLEASRLDGMRALIKSYERFTQNS